MLPIEFGSKKKFKTRIMSHAFCYISRILESCKTTDFRRKSHDFEKLVFDPEETRKVLFFKEYIQQKLDQSAR
jgi:hypothetical protein